MGASEFVCFYVLLSDLSLCVVYWCLGCVAVCVGVSVWCLLYSINVLSKCVEIFCVCVFSLECSCGLVFVVLC